MERWGQMGAYIRINGEQFHLGDFIIEEHAAITYLIAKAEAKLKKEEL